MNLYSRLKNPKLFQRNLLIRRILCFRLDYVLKQDNKILTGYLNSKKPMSISLINAGKEWVAPLIQKILKR